jgi:putative FmdB family regulatory protein
MPMYDYLCTHCGPFTEMMPMENYADDAICPDCGAGAPRALLSVPHFSAMGSNRFKAQAINEQSAHAPATSARTGRHPPGCGCCGTSRQSKAKPEAAKSFPGTRPWMISH